MPALHAHVLPTCKIVLEWKLCSSKRTMAALHPVSLELEKHTGEIHQVHSFGWGWSDLDAECSPSQLGNVLGLCSMGREIPTGRVTSPGFSLPPNWCCHICSASVNESKYLQVYTSKSEMFLMSPAFVEK